MATEPRPERPVLDYATKDADGLPDCIPEADELIAKRVRPKAIRHLFARTEDVVKYYARAMSRRYGAETLKGLCVSCSCENPQFIVRVQWRTTCKFKRAEFRPWESEASAEFSTLHPICLECYGDWVRRLTRFAGTSVFLWLIGVLAIVVYLLVLGAEKLLSARTVGLKTILLVGYFGAMLGSRLFNRLSRRRWPRFLLKHMPKDVWFEGIEDLFVREGDVLKSAAAMREPFAAATKPS